MDWALTILTSTGMSAFVVWLAKSWISERLKNSIKHEYDEKLETHKIELRSQSDIEIEKLKSQLGVTAREHEIRFILLHEKRAEVLAETYALLRALDKGLRDYVSMFESTAGPSREERRDVAADAHAAFQLYYVSKLIFFPEETANRLETIDQQLVTSFNIFAIQVDTSNGPDKTKTWMEVNNKIESEIKPALDELANEFRKLLGTGHHSLPQG